MKIDKGFAISGIVQLLLALFFSRQLAIGLLIYLTKKPLPDHLKKKLTGILI